MNIPRVHAALLQIVKHPESWEQGAWHTGCGTAHCLAGWGQIHAGKCPDGVNASYSDFDAISDAAKDAAIEWFEMDLVEAENFFDPDNSLEYLACALIPQGLRSVYYDAFWDGDISPEAFILGFDPINPKFPSINTNNA